MDPTQCFLSMIVVESLSCKLEWGLAQVFAISIPLTIVAMESEVYECQTKYAKAIFVGMSARNGCHGTAGLRYLQCRLRHLTNSNPGIQAIGRWA